MNTRQMHEAKACLSEAVKRAELDGPQETSRCMAALSLVSCPEPRTNGSPGRP